MILNFTRPAIIATQLLSRKKTPKKIQVTLNNDHKLQTTFIWASIGLSMLSLYLASIYWS